MAAVEELCSLKWVFHVECLRFCNMDLIKDEVHRFARLLEQPPNHTINQLRVFLRPPRFSILSARDISHTEFPCVH